MARQLASLTSGLLARKGAARPAMRSPLGGYEPLGEVANPERPQDDLGWNDYGAPEAAPAPVPAQVVNLVTETVADIPAEPPQVVRQQREIAARIAAPLISTPIRSSALAAGRRAAFTLRLDAERHLALRVAATITGRSAQVLVTEALDRLLAEYPEIPAIADNIRKHR